jgi:hypothetical protein
VAQCASSRIICQRVTSRYDADREKINHSAFPGKPHWNSRRSSPTKQYVRRLSAAFSLARFSQIQIFESGKKKMRKGKERLKLAHLPTRSLLPLQLYLLSRKSLSSIETRSSPDSLAATLAAYLLSRKSLSSILLSLLNLWDLQSQRPLRLCGEPAKFPA